MEMGLDSLIPLLVHHYKTALVLSIMLQKVKSGNPVTFRVHAKPSAYPTDIHWCLLCTRHCASLQTGRAPVVSSSEQLFLYLLKKSPSDWNALFLKAGRCLGSQRKPGADKPYGVGRRGSAVVLTVDFFPCLSYLGRKILWNFPMWDHPLDEWGMVLMFKECSVVVFLHELSGFLFHFYMIY